MTEELYEWLKFRWSRDNHRKYHKYFDVWIENISPNQIHHFTIQEKRRNIYNTKK